VYQAACQLGCEGIVSKRLGSPYRSGRSLQIGVNADRVMGANRVRAFLMVLIGTLLLGGCAAKQKTESTQPANDIATSGAGPPVTPDNLHLARDEYDRAVAN